MAKTKVYHWTAAVRIEHWWHLASMIVLVLTGFYIHSPFTAGGGGTMAWMRWFHLVFAYVLIFGLLVRTYLAFNSRTRADWKELMPLPRNLAGIPEMVAYYLFLKGTHRPYVRYNPLQALVYFLMGLMLLIMAATGFALHTGWLHCYFTWVDDALGGVMMTRVVHFLVMWLLICSSAVHLYFVLRQDLMEHDRTLMSMIDGYRETEE